MRLFDSHAHIDDKCFDDDFSAVLGRAKDAQVEAIMIVGINLETSEKAIELADYHRELFASVGVHPHDTKYCSNKIIEDLKDRASYNCVKAWGETGLDFNRMHSPPDIQEKWLLKQIEVADELDMPMIFHERDSNGRFLEILESVNHKQRKAVVHCFSGSKEEMFKYLDMGYYIGITGILTIQKRGQYLREIAPLIPEDRILIETDAPYLTPAPMKNKTRRNEPAFVRSVLMKLAQVRNTDVETLAKSVWENTCNLYDIIESDIGKGFAAKFF